MAVDGNAFQSDEVDLEALGEELDRALAGVSAPPDLHSGQTTPATGSKSGASPGPVQPPTKPPQERIGGHVDTSQSTERGSASVQRARFAPLAEEPVVGAAPSSIELLLDINLRVSVELGRTTLTVRDTLNLAPGSVVELDKLAGDPVDILVNGRLIAKGEVVVVDDQFGVRITEIISPRQRAEALR